MSYKSYYSSGKPALWGGTSKEHSSIVVTPPKYRAPIELPKDVRGVKLYNRGGTLATRVVRRSIPDTI
jgi:hypothetical protein